MLELLENLARQLESCTNREYFQAKKEALIDPASDMDAVEVAPEVADVPVDE